MISLIRKLKTIRQKASLLGKDERGLAGIEAAMLLPILVTFAFGVYDIGHGLIVKQKVVTASHMAADLLARKPAISDTDISDAVEAAKLAVDPYDRDNFGIDVASVLFTDDDDGEILWRYTENSDENANAVADSIGLGEEGEGVLVVTVHYEYRPFFYKMFFESVDIMEVAFLRGRKSSVVRHEDMI